MVASKGSKGGKSPIRIKPSHEGRLHKALGVPADQPIPAAKLAAAKKSSDPAVRRMATFAENAKGFSHTGGGTAKKAPAKAPAKKTTTQKKGK